MIEGTLLVFSVLFLLIGHYFKIRRWMQFIGVYERPFMRNLIQSLSLGYLINFFVPFRAGDAVRAIYSGRKMKNSISFSLATVVVDRYLDIIFVGVLFGLFWLLGIRTNGIGESVVFYLFLSLLLLFLSVLAIRYSKLPKLIISKISSIFNNNIEHHLLVFCWSFISSVKDMYKNLNRKNLLLRTLLMWTFYLISYYLFAMCVSRRQENYQFIDIFMMLFSRSSFDFSTGATGVHAGHTRFTQLFYIYMLAPLFCMLLISFLPKRFARLHAKADETTQRRYVNLLPQLDPKERLAFLEAYFSADSKDYFAKYLEINRNIHIIQDYSAGSNATTMLCLDSNQTFYRKYAIGLDADKLYDQVQWLRLHETQLPLANILREEHDVNFCYYDMAYNSQAIGMFNYAHSMPPEKSWNILKDVFEKLQVIYQQAQPCNAQTLQTYIDTKVVQNLQVLHNTKELRGLVEQDYIRINNIVYRNLPLLERYLDRRYLTDLFSHDSISHIHGDLTIENIVCVYGVKQDTFYLIDPNTGNLHDSPFLDYAKLLQSLHGGYEFLMKTKEVQCNGNNINFINVRSSAYKEIYEQYKAYLFQHFTRQQIQSIYFHELVHWLRLLPYKIKKDSKRCGLFYAGFIVAFNDIVELFELEDPLL